jgi:predicted nucleic acid-binding protein
MIAIDTNILVYAHRTAAKEHRNAKRVIERALDDPRGCGVAVACIAEFWAVVTHPTSPRPSTPAEAFDFISSLVDEAGVEVWPQTRELEVVFARTAFDLRVRGSRVFDLKLR